jgi:hypothetical protein
MGAVTGRNGAEKTVTVDVIHAFGSSANPTADFAFANSEVYGQARIRIQRGREVRLDEKTTRGILGDDLALRSEVDPVFWTRGLGGIAGLLFLEGSRDHGEANAKEP